MENHDLKVIFEQLKDKYDLVLTNTFALNDGYEIDVPVLCGRSLLGTFYLYKEDPDWDEFVFSVAHSDGHHDHWHPQSREQALEDVVAFMEGTHKFCL